MNDHTTNDTPVKLCECGCGLPAPIATKTDSASGRVKGMPQRYIFGHKNRRSAIERFWENVDVGEPTECWEWNAFCTKLGYGTFHVDGKLTIATRFSYELHYGTIPEGMCVCHRCDNPRCANPAHLFLGTRADNNQDRANKGRSVRALAKLTESQVAEIRQRYAQGLTTHAVLAAEYGVTRQAITSIISRKSWIRVP